jgi:DNA-binding NarL/FixJ family response regulator
VLVLSADLEVKAQTPETQQYLQILIPPEDDRPPVPAGAYNVAAQLLALEAGIDDHPPVTRVHLKSSTWLTLRAARIGVEHGTTDERDIAVTIELTTPAERLSLFARACGLTPREQDLLRLLATGADTRGIAKQMFVSEHTVQDHLKSIFAKSGTRNRRALLSIATGE